MTMQQVMGMMQGLQEALAASKAEQERMQADLVASQARNDELCRMNEELRRGWCNHTEQRDIDEPEPFTPPREFSTPFSQPILETVIPNTFTGPKVTFIGMEEPGEETPLRGKEAPAQGSSGANRPAREGNKPLRNNFVVELKDLIVVPNIADRLRPPVKSDKVLGPHKESWCKFHEPFGHHINNCLALGYQLDELVKNGFLKDYLAGPAATTALTVPEEDQAHEMPIHGEVHTISGGFSGGGTTASQRKRYVRAMNSVAERDSDDQWESDLVFTRF